MDGLLKWDTWNLFNRNKLYNFKIFIADEIANLKHNFFYDDPSNHLFKPKIDIIAKLNTTKSIFESDFILVPHPWISIKDNILYRKYLTRLSENTPLLMFNTDDLSPKCDLPNTLQIRTFLHPRENPYRKIILPYPAKQQNFKIRTWKQIPQISFIGLVPKLTLGSLTSKSRSFVHSPLRSSVYLNRNLATKKLERLKNEFKVVCTKRTTFTLLPDNQRLNRNIQEYQENLSESDYILCPRGFGNVSIRFYETLSSGATPLLIESGTKLPEINNNNFWHSNILVLRLFSDWAKIISKDWNYLGKSDNYLDRQLRNSQVFSSELFIQKYAEKIFIDYLLPDNK
jgi:hypothetical protein